MPTPQYDDPAFYIFAISLLSVYAVPATYVTVGKLLRATVLQEKITNRKLLPGEQEKTKRLATLRSQKVWSTCFVVQLVALALVWIVLFILLSSYSSGGDIKQFDPFEILELEHGATDNEIRRAFRKLSLRYHPDKNKGDQEAADKFMLISKAHESLTDEEAKKNMEEFGSPDGKQQLQVAIGLPSFFMNKGNHTAILIVYLVVLVVMVPVGVGTYYANSQKFGDNDIMKATYNTINALFRPEDNWNCKQIPEILGAAEELAELKHKSTDATALQKLWNKWEKAGDDFATSLVLKPKQYNPARADALKSKGSPGLAGQVFKAFLNNLALTAYLMRAPLSATSEENARTVLARSPKLVEAMIKASYMVGSRSQQTNSWHVVNELIHFEQRLYQSLWDIGDRSYSSFLQFPHLTEPDIKNILGRTRRNNRSKGNFTHAEGFDAFGQLQAYLRQTSQERRGLDNLSPEQAKDLHSVAEIMPNWDVDINVQVKQEEVISVGAVVSVTFTITRNEIPEGKTATEIFAPRFPDGKYEGIWLLMASPIPLAMAKKNMRSTRLHAIRKLQTTDRVVTDVIQFQAPAVGHYSIMLSVKSDSYFGCDFQDRVAFEVVPADSPELTAFERHEEDIQLLKELHGEVVGADEDSDSDSDDDDAPESKTSSKQEKVEEDAEDEESEDEESSDSSSDEE